MENRGAGFTCCPDQIVMRDIIGAGFVFDRIMFRECGLAGNAPDVGNRMCGDIPIPLRDQIIRSNHRMGTDITATDMDQYHDFRGAHCTYRLSYRGLWRQFC